ncbi:hypothetical protein N2152v2_007280 [Parachlorella kessleri]
MIRQGSRDPLSLAERGADRTQHPLSATPPQAPAAVKLLPGPRSRGQAAQQQAEDAAGTLSPLSLSDEEVDGVQRLAPDPDSPTSRLLEEAARRSLQEAQHKKGTPGKFSFSKDIARNPELAKAARAQLLDGGSNGSMQHLQHGAELDRQTAVIDQLDRDAREESSINQGLASVMLGRLHSARQASERVLGVLQAFAGAEAGYARAMEAAAKVSLVGDGDGPSLRGAMEGVIDLPMMLGASHSQLATKLGELIKVLQAVLNDVRAACEEIVHGAGRAKRSVEASRRALKAALAAHREACRAFDQVMAEQRRHAHSGGGGGRGRGLEQDPWLSEGLLVEQQTTLQQAQHSERVYLSKAFQRVGDLERRRVGALQDVFSNMVQLYRADSVPLQSDCQALELALQQVDAEGDLGPFWQAAASAAATGGALSARQAETLDQISRELMASPHIVRQGEMERWEQGVGRWVPSLYVLTQAGFLHSFDSAAAGATKQQNQRGNGRTWGGPATTPVTDSMNLSRCAFEQGEAPVFRLIETLPSLSLFGSKSRSRTLKAPSIEDCLDWAASIRDSIAAAGGR